MEYLKDTENFGETYKKDDDLERFFWKLLSWIERRIFGRISKRVNFVLKRVQDSRIELIAPDNNDKNQDGNWAIEVDSNGDLIFEKRVSGTWTEANKFHGS